MWACILSCSPCFPLFAALKWPHFYWAARESAVWALNRFPPAPLAQVRKWSRDECPSSSSFSSLCCVCNNKYAYVRGILDGLLKGPFCFRNRFVPPRIRYREVLFINYSLLLFYSPSSSSAHTHTFDLYSCSTTFFVPPCIGKKSLFCCTFLCLIRGSIVTASLFRDEEIGGDFVIKN